MSFEDKKQDSMPVRLGQQPEQLSLLKNVTDARINTQSLRFWDSLINAVFDDRKAVKRVAGKFLETDSRCIEFEGNSVEVVRYPARIGNRENEKEVFPMKRDYKILEALIKLAVDRPDSAFYQASEPVLGVKVSYYRVYQIFRQVTGKASFSYRQIEEALEVLRRAHMEFRFRNLEISGSLISSYVGTHEEDLKEREFRITFHPLISRLILLGGFREANLQRILAASDMFTIFLYKKFVHNFRQASRQNHYHFSMNLLLREAPTVASWKQVTRKIEKVSESLEKLSGDVVARWEAERKYSEGAGQRRTLDCVFKVWFTERFVEEQICANALSNQPDSQNARLAGYPERSDYNSTDAWMEALKAWHNRQAAEGGQIVEQVFSTEKQR